LEFVRRWGGADWYNDLIATAPERAMAAIRSFTEPIILLAEVAIRSTLAILRPGQELDHLIFFGEVVADARARAIILT
jgi:UDP-N-acetylmuramoylalanine-D-glutamate ligase